MYGIYHSLQLMGFLFTHGVLFLQYIANLKMSVFMRPDTKKLKEDVNAWSLDDLHLFWFGDGSKHNRGLVGDALRWLCYRPTKNTQDLVCSFLYSSEFDQICAPFGYSPEKFRAAASKAVASREAA